MPARRLGWHLGFIFSLDEPPDDLTVLNTKGACGSDLLAPPRDLQPPADECPNPGVENPANAPEFAYPRGRGPCSAAYSGGSSRLRGLPDYRSPGIED